MLGGRLFIAHRPETAAEAKAAAQLGRLPPELPLEVTVPSAAYPSLARENQHIVSVRMNFLPVMLEGGWAASRELLKRQVLVTLETYAPGFADRVIANEILTPADMAERYGCHETPSTPTRALATYAARIASPLPGLYFCGASAEPFDAISGRAGRLAAHMILGEGLA